MPHTPRIPDLPGDIAAQDHANYLRSFVAQLCNLNGTKFPGSQPVSFSQKDLTRLENEDYWVCEKSDGVRVLFLIQTLGGDEQNVYLIDRHNQYRQVHGFYFPHYEDPRRPLKSTILDGELVLDRDPRTGMDTLRYLAFDCLVVDGQNVMERPLDRRYGRLQEWFYKPYKKMTLDHPHMLQSQPFDVKVKAMELSYGVEKVLNEVVPKLQHGSDGLIYTCMKSHYVVGTDRNILKWKPPSENSIDFKLVLRFPPDRRRPSEPDFHAKPIFALYVFSGGRDDYEPFDEMYVDEEEWEQLKMSGEQIDDRIVEVYWESDQSRWRMMRFRDDKPNGNHKSVVENIIQSILDGVEKEDLLSRSNAIRTAWKLRQGQGPAQSQSQLQSQQQQQQFSSTSQIQPHGKQQPSLPPQPPPKLDLRYGPLQESPYSRVGGPDVVMGFLR